MNRDGSRIFLFNRFYLFLIIFFSLFRYLKRHRPRHFNFKNKETSIVKEEEKDIVCETIEDNNSILRLDKQ